MLFNRQKRISPIQRGSIAGVRELIGCDSFGGTRRLRAFVTHVIPQIE
jgi:hypothetical protein